jgi:hypothetical protein
VLAFISAWAYDGKMAVIFLTAGVMAAILWVKLKYLFFSPRAWAAVLAAVVVLLPARYTTRKHLTDENVFAWSDISYMNNVKLLPAGRAWREIEDLPRGSRIGFLASAPIGNAQYYPLFGRSLQFIPLPLMSNGALQQPLHITWDWLGLQDQSRAVVPEEFLRNLEQENVQYLIMTRALFTDTWPPQRNILDNSNKARRIYSDGFSIIWKIETG